MLIAVRARTAAYAAAAKLLHITLEMSRKRNISDVYLLGCSSVKKDISAGTTEAAWLYCAQMLAAGEVRVAQLVHKESKHLVMCASGVGCLTEPEVSFNRIATSNVSTSKPCNFYNILTKNECTAIGTALHSKNSYSNLLLSSHPEWKVSRSPNCA